MKRFLTLFFVAILSTSCVFIDVDRSSYIDGSADIYKVIDEIEIDWDYGTVMVRYWDEDYISFYEEDPNGPIKDCMCYYVRNRQLFLAYSRYNDTYYQPKKLMVFLPKGVIYRDIDIDVLDANIDVDADCRKIDIDTTSGDVVFSTTYRDIEDIDVDTVSGNVRLILPIDTSFTCEYDTVRGRLISQFGLFGNPSDKYYYGGPFYTTKIDVDTRDGNLELEIYR